MSNAFAIENAQVRFMHICNDFDPNQVVAFAVSHGFASDIQGAHYALRGLQQWLACHDYGGSTVSRHVMLSGPVYKMHQAFALNTVHYAQFCRTYLGEFVHMINMNTAEQVEFVRQTGWFDETINLLTEVFGNELSPTLSPWQQQYYNSEVPIAAVSLMGHDAIKYQKIIDMLPCLQKQQSFAHLRGRGMTVV